MARHYSKQAILDAAEAVAAESGASHLTLDAVAEHSGISKGGLTYHFPTKEALLEGMIGRMVDRFKQLREKVRQGLDPEEPNELIVELRTLQAKADTDHSLSTALLAAVANQPELITTFREELRDRFSNTILSQGNFTRLSMIFFAAVGVHSHDLFKLSFLNDEQRNAIFNELTRLASGGGDV